MRFCTISIVGLLLVSCAAHAIEVVQAELTQVDAVNDEIFDVATDRILFLDSGVLKFRDRSSGQETVIPDSDGRTAEYGYLSPRGAIFVARASGNDVGLYEWADGQLSILGYPSLVMAQLAPDCGGPVNFEEVVRDLRSTSDPQAISLMQFGVNNGSPRPIRIDSAVLGLSAPMDRAVRLEIRNVSKPTQIYLLLETPSGTRFVPPGSRDSVELADSQVRGLWEHMLAAETVRSDAHYDIDHGSHYILDVCSRSSARTTLFYGDLGRIDASSSINRQAIAAIVNSLQELAKVTNDDSRPCEGI